MRAMASYSMWGEREVEMTAGNKLEAGALQVEM